REPPRERTGRASECLSRAASTANLVWTWRRSESWNRPAGTGSRLPGTKRRTIRVFRPPRFVRQPPPPRGPISSAGLCGLRGFQQSRHQRVALERPFVPLAIDEERRRAVHAAAQTTEVVGPHPPCMCSRRELLHEPFRIHACLLRGAGQRFVVEPVVVRVQERDHLPETPLLRRRFGRLGGAVCAR